MKAREQNKCKKNFVRSFDSSTNSNSHITDDFLEKARDIIVSLWMRKSKNIVDAIKVKISVGANSEADSNSLFFSSTVQTATIILPSLSPAYKCQVNDEVLEGADEELERHFARRRIVLQVRQVSD